MFMKEKIQQPSTNTRYRVRCLCTTSQTGLPPLPLFAENFRFFPFFPLFFRCSAFFRFFVFYAFLYKQLYFPIENSA
jgi:hypothetical protein